MSVQSLRVCDITKRQQVQALVASTASRVEWEKNGP